MITGGKRWRRYEISAIAPAYPQPVSPASSYPDKAWCTFNDEEERPSYEPTPMFPQLGYSADLDKAAADFASANKRGALGSMLQLTGGSALSDRSSTIHQYPSVKCNPLVGCKIEARYADE